MNILITCALPVEFNVARNQLGLRETTNRKDRPRIGIRKNISLIYTGIGKINTAISLYEYLKVSSPHLVIDSGTCGSLRSDIKIGDIIVSNRCLNYFNINNSDKLYSSKKEGIEPILPSIRVDDYIIASIEDSITTDDFKTKLVGNDASVVSWETSSVFAVCDKIGIPCISIRGVTDMCDGYTYKDFKLNKVEVCKKLYNFVKTHCMSI